MRIRTICAALLLFALPASAQTSAPACNRPPREAVAPPSAQVLAARKGMREACAADVASYCSNVPRECGGQMRCLMSHRSQLSAGCTSAWQSLRAARSQHG
jgi:hypothetical protein